MASPAHAGMLSTEKALASDSRERIAEVLNRAEVQRQLERHGVSAADVQARVAGLTDDEAALLAERIDELPAGGVLGLLLAVFIVLLITDILGLTKVFPFTKPVCKEGRC